jgi:hypothetical protein
MKYESHITFYSTDMDNVQFLKSRSNFKVKVRRSKIMVSKENRLVIRNMANESF